MSVLAVTASRTSPGATSLATGLALASSAEFDRSLLIEADPAGGVLSLRFDLDVTPSLTTFGSDTRNGYSHDLIWRNTQDLRGAHCIPAPVDPRLARSWVERVTPDLVEHLPTLGAPVVIDLGWVAESGPSLQLAAAADMTLVVTRPEIAEVQALLFQVRQLQAAGATVGLVTVGTTPNDPQEVAAVSGAPLVAVLPDDPKIAAALRGAKFSPNKFRRSLLWRTISGMAAALVDPSLVLARAADIAAATPELSTEAFGIAPTAYADLAPEALAAEHPHGDRSMARPAPEYRPDAIVAPAVAMTPAAPVAPSHPSPPASPVVSVAPMGSPARPSDDRPSFEDRHRIVATVSVDTADHTTDPDQTIDPDLFDVTSRIEAVPEAELLVGSERHLLDPVRPNIIGRHGECDVVVADTQVSRRHIRVTRTVTGWHFADLGSRNGTVLNGRPSTEAFLAEGDELFVGTARLVFRTVPADGRDESVTPIRETECA